MFNWSFIWTNLQNVKLKKVFKAQMGLNGYIYMSRALLIEQNIFLAIDSGYNMVLMKIVDSVWIKHCNQAQQEMVEFGNLSWDISFYCFWQLLPEGNSKAIVWISITPEM